MGPQFEVSGAYGPRLPKIVRVFCRLFALMFAIGVWPPPVFGDGGSGSGAVLPAPLTSPILNESAPPPSESGRIPESKGKYRASRRSQGSTDINPTNPC